MGDLLRWLAFGVVGFLLNMFVYEQLRKRIRKSNASAGIVDAALRDKSGEQPGVTGKWVNGTVSASPGHLNLLAHDGRRVSMRVLELTGSPTRDMGLTESLNEYADLAIIEATTATAVVEIAIEDESIDWLAARLSGEAS